jgi:hypothetical protein
VKVSPSSGYSFAARLRNINVWFIKNGLLVTESWASSFQENKLWIHVPTRH